MKSNEALETAAVKDVVLGDAPAAPILVVSSRDEQLTLISRRASATTLNNFLDNAYYPSNFLN